MRMLSSLGLLCLYASISVFTSCNNGDDEHPMLAYPNLLEGDTIGITTSYFIYE